MVLVVSQLGHGLTEFGRVQVSQMRRKILSPAAHGVGRVAGGPVLTAVPEKCLDAWKEFTGDRGTTLLCAPRVVEEWWREVSLRRAGARAALQATPLSVPIFRSSHRTT